MNQVITHPELSDRYRAITMTGTLYGKSSDIGAHRGNALTPHKALRGRADALPVE
jgi:hypothetical protein